MSHCPVPGVGCSWYSSVNGLLGGGRERDLFLFLNGGDWFLDAGHGGPQHPTGPKQHATGLSGWLRCFSRARLCAGRTSISPALDLAWGLEALQSILMGGHPAPSSFLPHCSEQSLLLPDFDPRGAGASFNMDTEAGFNACVLTDPFSVLGSQRSPAALPASAQDGHAAAGTCFLGL